MVGKKFGLSLVLAIVTALMATGCSSAPEQQEQEPDPSLVSTVDSPELKTESCRYCYVSTYGSLVCITYPC